MGNGKNKKPSKKQQQQGLKLPSDPDSPALRDTGCLVCGKDDDHALMLLCEVCNGEYHTYCLEPKLSQVPDNAWYCGESVISDAWE